MISNPKETILEFLVKTLRLDGGFPQFSYNVKDKGTRKYGWTTYQYDDLLQLHVPTVAISKTIPELFEVWNNSHSNANLFFFDLSYPGVLLRAVIQIDITRSTTSSLTYEYTSSFVHYDLKGSMDKLVAAMTFWKLAH